MDEMLSRIWEQLIGRFEGPLVLRFVLQPTVAILLAVRAGIVDARNQRTPYLWTVLSDPAERPNLIRGGFRDVAKVFVLAIVLDAVYQFLVFRWIYPGQALFIAVMLAIVPYALVRGPVTRLAARRRALAPKP